MGVIVNFSSILRTYVLIVTIFIDPVRAMHEQQTQQSSVFARSLSNSKSAFNKVADLFIKYALFKPAQLWFENQPKSEQERIVLESQTSSIAHASFKKRYGSQAYKKLLSNFVAPNNTLLYNQSNQLSINALGILYLLVSSHFLPILQYSIQKTPLMQFDDTDINHDQQNYTQSCFQETKGTPIKQLPEAFLQEHSICQTNPYIQHTAHRYTTPYDQECYTVVGTRSHDAFIGCNAPDNFHVICCLVNINNKTIFCNRFVITGNLAHDYWLDKSHEEIYITSDNANISREELYNFDNLEKFSLDCSADNFKSNLDNCVITIIKNITATFQQQTLPSLHLLQEEMEDDSHCSRACYSPEQDSIYLNNDYADSLIATVGIMAHELGHRTQGKTFLMQLKNEDQKLFNSGFIEGIALLASKKSDNTSKFNIERNADQLGSLALFVMLQAPEIMPITLLKITNIRNQIIAQGSNNLAKLTFFSRHPQTLDRIKYTLELAEKLTRMAKKLSKSFDLTKIKEKIAL